MTDCCLTDCRSRKSEAGAMLIVALAVLTLLVLIASTFAALMRLERRATENFKNLRRAEMIATSAESSVIAMLRSGPFWSAFTTWNKLESPWIYGVATGESQLGNRAPLEIALPGEVSYSWQITSTYPEGHDYFKTKVIDTAAQINLNGRQDTLADMLDNLGEALKRDYRWGKNPFFARYPEAGDKLTGRRILEFRAKLEGGVFASKTQLKEVLGEKNFSILEDFVTTHSWVDTSTTRGSDGLEENSDFSGTGRTRTTADNSTLSTEITGVARLETEDRAPININTAPRPVLIAVLMGLGCRRPFPFVTVERQRMEERNRSVIDIGDSTLTATDEELTLRTEPVWVHSEPLTADKAELIATAIEEQRKNQPFRAWQMPPGEPGGFEEFVNALPDNAFPTPQEMSVVNPKEKNRQSPRYKSALLDSGSEVGKAFGKGHANGGFRRSVGLPVSTRYAWYYDMMRGMLLANFNPNTRVNKYNPNTSAYLAVDKSNLIKLEQEGAAKGAPRPGHTTEFCFDSGGIFEIVSFSQITGPGTGRMTTAIASEGGTPSAENDFAGQERFAYVKQRSIVKVFEIMRHTTQADFEQPFIANSQSSARNRKFVNTFPDPMDMLGRDLSFGSSLDGRVEVRGHIDSIREDQDPTVRMNVPGERQANCGMYHGFSYRDEASMKRLESISRRKSRTEEFSKELRKALDPDYSSKGGGFDKRYTSDRWEATKSSDESENLLEPVIGPIDLGGDIMPDGLHSSMFRSTALGARFLIFPASKVRSAPDDQGALFTKANDTGNLAYYNGGVAFWVKFEFDGDDPVFCGLLKATQVQTEVGDSPEDSEGTQFYIWKNTSGELRVSRLYYHQAFRKDQTDVAVPTIGTGEENENADVELDPKKKQARTDVVIDIKDWKAHEWHHVAVEYNDERAQNRVRVLLDFEEAAGLINDMGEEQFCALNEEEPKDCLYVGSFYRDQATADEGLFKFNTNQTENREEVAASIKRILSNATIDEFTTFNQTYSPPYGETGYFTDKTAEYANMFSIAIPDGVQRLRFRSLSWTAYYPRSYSGRPVSTKKDDISFLISGIGTSSGGLQPVNDPAGDALKNENIAGKWIYAKGGAGTEARVCELVYQVRMKAARGTEKYGRFYVATPVLDDVTITYYLPTAQYLLTETY